MKFPSQVVLNSTVYINSIVIALTGVIGYSLAGTIINFVGKKKLMGKKLVSSNFYETIEQGNSLFFI